MSKVLVTGGAGFVGSNLTDELVEDGDEVIVVDDLSMGILENLKKSPQIKFYQKSITDYEFMKKLLINEEFDYIYLLAAVASVADSVARPYETHKINQDANIFILETIRKHKLNVKKILFTSSAAIYGSNLQLPKKEDSPVDPLTPYAIDKFATERFVIDYGRLYGLPTVAVRFFNVYGPRQNPQSPYSGVLSLISQAIKHRSAFTLFGDGKQTRDFVFIKDVIQALILLTKQNKVTQQVFNVGSGQFVSLLQVIKTYESISNTQLKMIVRPERLGDIKNSYANIDKIELLGYNPKFDIETGLRLYWKSLN
ncbi:NAD-dependent epimerase/dehydratase family protein [Pediococcus ethanolidurans]|uniref:NAD dependent epimerase dehydratase family protein n=1 Tax=Pediococcus ethanolidurans TaxID=319653 RepID=A0A0R2K159_9LACO|nr:NAD-dependent epimerase/dehydratase family protein [Pediococcus ethanolidurans]KRN81478.1 NAD dependent epimerase dehydratase family protein [Pediococcus ethanolidurans]GEN95259.1 epimerase [Pediococcus ethanolidurans]SER60999.1 UDP-glucose 4-epimerase [Pediococcus ethanolidurans]